MTSRIQRTVDALQSLHATIEGVRESPQNYLPSVSTAQLPLVIVWPGPGNSTMLTAKGHRSFTERRYSVRCYMEPLGQGDYNTAPYDGQELLNRFIQTYFANPTLDDGYVTIESVRDSGIVAGVSAFVGANTLEMAGGLYKGFICDLTIKEVNVT